MRIEELIKDGQLIEIEPEKVSLVKSPANRRRFIFTKAADLEFTIKSDQTFDGTSLMINGEELKDLDGFNFSLVNWSEENMEEWGAIPFSASWTRRLSSEDGIDTLATFSLHSEVRKEMDKPDVIEALKKNLGIELDEAGYDKIPLEKQKALESIAIFSPTFNGQPAFRNAVGVFVKSGTEPEEDPKEEPKEDPKEDPKETPSGDPTEADRIKALEDKLAQMEAAAAGKGSEAEEPEPAVVAKAIEDMQKQVAAIAKAAGVKQSSETEIEKSGEGKDEWKSWEV